ncbi:hypothetical protein DBA29_27260 [Xenophilus aerolatus]|nr:hypothetical protein [Xenophilus aerolatus]
MSSDLDIGVTRRHMLLAAGGAALSVPAWAQADYPKAPIKLVVPFAPGGGTDVSARMFADGLRQELGQSVVVDNRPGATGTLGTAFGMRAPADGYTLIFTTSTNQVIAPLLMEKPPYDGAKDFTPVTLLIRFGGVLLASNSFPGKTFQEFVAYAKQRPGKLNYASSGIGSTNHLLGEMLKNRTGMELVHVPYKGSAPASTALAADEVQLFFDTIPSAQNWLQQGKVKVLATTGDKRSSVMPDVPTLVEMGVFDGTTDYWMGLVAPPGLPGPILSRVHDAASRVMAKPEIIQFAARTAGEPAIDTPARFASLLADEQRRWGEVIRKNHIRAE